MNEGRRKNVTKKPCIKPVSVASSRPAAIAMYQGIEMPASGVMPGMSLALAKGFEDHSLTQSAGRDLQRAELGGGGVDPVQVFHRDDEGLFPTAAEA